MTAKERLVANGYEDVVCFENLSYDDALIGVTADNRAVYDYDKMVEWCVTHEEMTEAEAVDWIDYNTIRALPYIEDAPVIVYGLKE